MDGCPDEIKKHRFLTVEQVAEELNVSAVQIRALLKAGDLRGIQIGGRNVWCIAASDVEDYIAEAYRLTAERIAAGDPRTELAGRGPIEHFGERLRASKFGHKMTRDMYAYPSRAQKQRPKREVLGEQPWEDTALCYRDDEHTQHSDLYLLWQRDVGLRNFDLSRDYFSSLDADEFETALQHSFPRAAASNRWSHCRLWTARRAHASWSSTSTSTSISVSRGTLGSGSSSIGVPVNPSTG
jgi:excisionase family DNA binding protein